MDCRIGKQNDQRAEANQWGGGSKKGKTQNPQRGMRLFQRLFSTRHTSNTIRIVEVGPRDGLQNEKTYIPTAVKLDFIRQLVDAGILVVLDV